jgi:serine/threonine protein kinase
VDFGFAHDINSAQAKKSMGTPGYIAPEGLWPAIGSGPVDQKLDIYAAGLLLMYVWDASEPDGDVTSREEYLRVALNTLFYSIEDSKKEYFNTIRTIVTSMCDQDREKRQDIFTIHKLFEPLIRDIIMENTEELSAQKSSSSQDTSLVPSIKHPIPVGPTGLASTVVHYAQNMIYFFFGTSIIKPGSNSFQGSIEDDNLFSL